MSVYTYHYVCRYDVMLLCWHLNPRKRPRFSSLVTKLSEIIEVEAGYLDLSQSFVLETGVQSHSSPDTTVTLPTIIEEQRKEDEEKKDEVREDA